MGVDAGGVLTTLLERGLIRISGREEGPGRPLLYGTTPEFMEHFGLRSLRELPRIDDIAGQLDRHLLADDIARELGGEPEEFAQAISGHLDPEEEAEAPAKADPAADDEPAESTVDAEAAGDTSLQDESAPPLMQ